MATYASKTNPFIEKAKNDLEPPPLAKTAPGMARLLSKTKIQDKNLLLSLDETTAVGPDAESLARVARKDLNNNSNPAGDVVANSEDKEGGEKIVFGTNGIKNNNRIAEGGENFEAEIAEACRSLVDAAARLSLDESGGDAEAGEETEIGGREAGIAIGTEVVKLETCEKKKEAKPAYLQTIARPGGCSMDDSIQDNTTTSDVFKSENDEDEDDGEEEDESIIGESSTSNDDNNNNLDKGHSRRKLSTESDRRKHQHLELIRKLRLQLRDLERYAYERGDLEQVPQSVMAEKQSVIIDTLKEKLSLNLDKETIANLKLDELKKQVDKEINELVDPIATKEHLLNQLKTQLTDLERYVSHLHDTIDRNKRKSCSCQVHGCSPSTMSSPSSSAAQDNNCKQSHSNTSGTHKHHQSNLMYNDALPRTAYLIRTLVAQIICSDMKIQDESKKELARMNDDELARTRNESQSSNEQEAGLPVKKVPQFHDGATWTIHIDKVVLATDSLMNLFETSEQPKHRGSHHSDHHSSKQLFSVHDDPTIVESVVRRQLVPAIKELLTYGLIDPSSFPRSASSYASFLLDPYYLLSSLTCFPSLTKSTASNGTITSEDKIHIWNIIADYYESRSGPNFKQSSVKTLSQSFNLTPSMNGPIKITSKQALLIAVDEIIDRMSRCKPNGPESHFKAFVYVALNQGKLATWLRLIFRNKSVIRKYYHNFSFVSQQEKMDRFISVIDVLKNIQFKLDTDDGARDQFLQQITTESR